MYSGRLFQGWKSHMPGGSWPCVFPLLASLGKLSKRYEYIDMQVPVWIQRYYELNDGPFFKNLFIILWTHYTISSVSQTHIKVALQYLFFLVTSDGFPAR